MKTEIPQTGFYFDAGTTENPKHDYWLDGKRMTGVTTILGVLAKPALIPWAARMAVEYIQNHPETHRPTSEKIETWNSVLEEAKTAYAKKRDEGAEKGTDTHALVEEFIKEAIVGFDWRVTPGKYKPIRPFIEWAAQEQIRFLGSEVQLYSKEMFVAGTADFIFEKDGKTYIGDIKTYKKIWDRTPFYQCAGYSLMWEEMKKSEKDEETLGTVGVKLGLHQKLISGYVIFNLPKERAHNPDEDVLWSFDTEGDTKAFLACLEIYRQNARFIKPSYKSKK